MAPLRQTAAQALAATPSALTEQIDGGTLVTSGSPSRGGGGAGDESGHGKYRTFVRIELQGGPPSANTTWTPS